MIKKHIGSVGVDSGGLIIIDPAYLGDWKDGEYGEDNHYTEACKARDKKGVQEFIVSGVEGNAVGFSSGYGDGVYPVYAYINEEDRVVKIEIDFE